MVLWFRRGNTCFGLVQGSWYTASEIVAMSQVVRGMGTSFVTFWSSIFGSWNCSKVIKVKSVCCSSGHRSFTHISIHAYDFWTVPKDWWGWGAAWREMGTGLFWQLHELRWKISEHHKKLPVETTNGTIPSLYKKKKKWEGVKLRELLLNYWWWASPRCKQGPSISINLWEILFCSVQPKLPLLF